MSKYNAWNERTALDESFSFKAPEVAESDEFHLSIYDFTMESEENYFDENGNEILIVDDSLDEALNKKLDAMRSELVKRGHYAAKPGGSTIGRLNGTHEELHNKLKAAADHYYSLPHEERKKIYDESKALRGGRHMISPVGSNPKTAKETPGHVTTLMHLPSYKDGGINTCPHATTGEHGCVAGCIYNTGRGGMSTTVAGRRERLHHMWHNPVHAIAQIDHEIHSIKKTAAKHGAKAAIRLNGTSDMRWHKIAPQMFKEHHDVQFYDYTKNVDTIKNHHEIPKNYDVTFSSNGIEHGSNNWHHAREYLKAGGKVAVAFARAPKKERNGKITDGHHLPTHVHDEETGQSWKVHNGDSYDGRFADHKLSGTKKGEGLIVGLTYKRSKGRSWKNAKAFAWRGKNTPPKIHDEAGKVTKQPKEVFTVSKDWAKAGKESYERSQKAAPAPKREPVPAHVAAQIPDHVKDMMKKQGHVFKESVNEPSLEEHVEQQFNAGLRLLGGMKKKTRGFDGNASESKAAVRFEPESLVEGLYGINESTTCQGCDTEMNAAQSGGGRWDVCMDCTKARHRAVMNRGKCSCGKKAKPREASANANGKGRKWLACDRCLGTIKQLN